MFFGSNYLGPNALDTFSVYQPAVTSLTLPKELGLPSYIISESGSFLSLSLQFYSCKDAAQQVLMSVTLSVLPWSISNSNCLQPSQAFHKLQNVPECYRIFQNDTECYRMYAECSRMYEDSSRMYAECSRMFQNVFRMHADPLACMQLHKLTCSYLSLHAVR